MEIHPSLLWYDISRLPCQNRILLQRAFWRRNALVRGNRQIGFCILHLPRYVDWVGKVAIIPVLQEAAKQEEETRKIVQYKPNRMRPNPFYANLKYGSYSPNVT